MKYRRKHSIVNAFRLNYDSIPPWFRFAIEKGQAMLHGKHGYDLNSDIYSHDGIYHANAGDYIVKDELGDIFVCTEKIFNSKYEAIE